MSFFTVTHTKCNKTITAGSNTTTSRVSHLADRTDLPTAMAAQRFSAFKSRRIRIQEASLEDYKGTFASRDVHCGFLAMMLNEAHQYHHRTFGVLLPLRAFKILAAQITNEMKKNPQDSGDHYAQCLTYLGRQGLYSVKFQETAAFHLDATMEH